MSGADRLKDVHTDDDAMLKVCDSSRSGCCRVRDYNINGLSQKKSARADLTG